MKIHSGFILFLFLFLLEINCTKAQDNSLPDQYYQQLNIGLGFGLDYGGFGVRFTGLPDQHLAIFVGTGYNYNGLGYNFGASYRFTPMKKSCWYYTMMYGYNAVLVIQNATELNKTYYGISAGFGVEVHSRKQPGNFWNFELLIPIRTQEYHDDIIYLMNSTSIDLKSEPLPFAICVGYHFRLN